MMFWTVFVSSAIVIVSASVPPVVDISALFLKEYNHEKVLKTAALIDHILQQYGVFVAVGHNLSSDLLQRNEAAMHELFKLPKEDKERVSLKQTTAFGRGYLGFGEESGLSEYFEPKEGFSYGYPDNVAAEAPNELQSRNFFPSSLSEESRNTLIEVYYQKVLVAQRLIFALNKYFNIHSSYPDNYLRDITSHGHEISLMRLFHYYNVNDEIVANKLREFSSSSSDNKQRKLQIIGSSPHTDWGLLTLILQDDAGGLEFFHADTWHAVSPSTAAGGGIIVNGGDYLSMISNYRYHSPIHRVLSPNTTTSTIKVANSDVVCESVDAVDDSVCNNDNEWRERYSMVFFYYPNYDSTISYNQYSDYKFNDNSISSNNNKKNKLGSINSSNKKASSELNYNTLEFTGAVKDSHRFDQQSKQQPEQQQSEVVKFGDYIIRKWKGVSRAY